MEINLKVDVSDSGDRVWRGSSMRCLVFVKENWQLLRKKRKLCEEARELPMKDKVEENIEQTLDFQNKTKLYFMNMTEPLHEELDHTP